MNGLKPEKLKRLLEETVIWFATFDGTKPHLVPIWFVESEGDLWICTSSTSKKARNLSINPYASFSIQDGKNPVIGEAELVEIMFHNFPEVVTSKFKKKYDWDLDPTSEYDSLIRLKVNHWLMN